MNRARRKELERARALIAQARDIIDTAASEEQDYQSNMPENIQSGPKGDRSQEIADELLNVSGDIDELLGRIEECET